MEKDQFSQGSSSSVTDWLDIFEIGGWISALISILVGLAVIAFVLYTIVAIVVTIPLWGGMLLISSVTTIVFAEALKGGSEWALLIRNKYGFKSTWLGPITAIVFSVPIFMGMVAYMGPPTTTEIFVSLIICGITLWICRRIVEPIVRWRLAKTVKEKNQS